MSVISNRVIKKFGGFPCAHRQWKADSHCKYIHGYDRIVIIEWEGPRDETGWVLDFGGLKPLRTMLENQFDHTTLIAPDDPALEHFRKLSELDAISLRIMDPTMEGMAEWVAVVAQEFTNETFPGRKIVRVECWENEKNCAVWVP